MRKCLILFFMAFFAFAAQGESRNSCTCKCVIKEDGKYGTAEASGKDREAAGNKLKEKLGKKTCELTPVCSGKCTID